MNIKYKLVINDSLIGLIENNNSNDTSIALHFYLMILYKLRTRC